MSFQFQEFLPQEMWEIQEQWPALASLAIVEVLLSADNVVGISNTLGDLPPKRRILALRLSLGAAFIARAVLLVVAAPYIAQYAIIRLLGALYLIYLASAHFTGNRNREIRQPNQDWSFAKTLATIMGVNFILSMDNVVAAVSISRTPWVVWSSVLFGFVFLGLLGKITMHLFRKFTVLFDSVFVLIGALGGLLLTDVVTKTTNLSHIQDEERFFALVIILVSTLIYDASAGLQRALGPVIRRVVLPILRLVHFPLSYLFLPLRKLTKLASH
ncbi:MAG: hypothetical protein WCL08_09260 [Verrucomicrobiota bacterium]